MTALDWLLWAATIWAAWLAFVFADVPTFCARLATRYRHGGGPR